MNDSESKWVARQQNSNLRRWNLDILNCGNGHSQCGALHITAATTALRLLIGSVEARFENSRRRSTVLLTLGLRLGRENNEFFVAAFAASFESSQNRCVVAASVMRDAAALQDGAERKTKAFGIGATGEFRVFARTDLQPNPQSVGEL